MRRMMRIGSEGCARKIPDGAFTIAAGIHCASLNPALVQVPNSLRASYSSPSYSLLVRIGPSTFIFQPASETIEPVDPSAYSISSRINSFG